MAEFFIDAHGIARAFIDIGVWAIFLWAVWTDHRPQSGFWGAVYLSLMGLMILDLLLLQLPLFGIWCAERMGG
jgi:hypothetical protein